MSREVVQIVAALVRRAGSLLMVRQAGPGEEPFWSIPSGRVEEGELATEALARELREETGLAAAEDAVIAFSAQVDDPLTTVVELGPARATGSARSPDAPRRP